MGVRTYTEAAILAPTTFQIPDSFLTLEIRAYPLSPLLTASFFFSF